MEQALRLVEVVLLGLILVSLWAVFYQLVVQQGRLLLRLDDVERRVAHGGSSPATGALVASDAPSQPRGLATGTPLLPFRLPNLSGQVMGLGDWRGQRLLLINWNPQCGFCDLIAPELARLQAQLHENNVDLVLVSPGTADSNRKWLNEQGLECPVLLQDGGSRSIEAFNALGTPVAYLLDEEGRVAEPLAIGADQVLDLMHRSCDEQPKTTRLSAPQSLSASRIERHGLAAGTPAPNFTLTDVQGGAVSLESYRGQRVLLVFSDPHCGPCDELAPHLVRLHRQGRESRLTLLMVGRGDVEENRRKVEEHGFEFPLVLQKHWQLSKDYGIFATPVAFLIDEEGVIVRRVAKGVEEILTLAEEATANGSQMEARDEPAIR